MAEILWTGAAFLTWIGGFALVGVLHHLGREVMDPGLRESAKDDRPARFLLGLVEVVYYLGLAVILVGAVVLGLWFGNHA